MRHVSWLLMPAIVVLFAFIESAAQQPTGPAPADRPSTTVTLHFFWSETCPHCARAEPFIRDLAAERPWLAIDSREVSGSPENRRAFSQMAAEIGAEIEGVPTFFLCGRMIVGFDDADGIGAALTRLAVDCHAARQAETALPPMPTPKLTDTIGGLDPAGLSLPVLTVVLAGLDAFNPCAFFVLLFLLSLMVHAGSRARMLMVGAVFVAISGLLYFAFMAAWLNLFLVLGGLRYVTAVAGLVAIGLALFNIKDFAAVGPSFSLSIPDSAKPRLFARMRGLLATGGLPALIAGTATLAAAANTYELLCTSGFPLVYARVLTLNEVSTAGRYLYLAFYNAVYVLPLLAIVAVFAVSLGGRKLSEREGRALKLLSGAMMLGLGLVLLIAPDLLNSVATAVALLAGAVIVTGVAQLFEQRRDQQGD
ncbi:MAG: thioredoxin family protein [Inquilinus sp.]|nr:thioredoxin family protein [Inquilinus sp.]